MVTMIYKIMIKRKISLLTDTVDGLFVDFA